MVAFNYNTAKQSHTEVDRVSWVLEGQLLHVKWCREKTTWLLLVLTEAWGFECRSLIQVLIQEKNGQMYFEWKKTTYAYSPCKMFFYIWGMFQECALQVCGNDTK